MVTKCKIRKSTGSKRRFLGPEKVSGTDSRLFRGQKRCQEPILGCFNRPGGPTVDSKRSRCSARSRHDWENQTRRKFVSMFEAAVAEAAVVTRHDLTTAMFAQP